MTQCGPPSGEDNEDEAAKSALESNEQQLKSKGGNGRDKKISDDDNAESESTSSSQGLTSGEGYTADCSSDASSDLSGSAKKKEKDNMIVSVNDLSIDDDSEAASNVQKGDSRNNKNEGRNENLLAPAALSEQAGKDNNINHKDKTKKTKKKSRRLRAAPADNQDSLDGDSDMSGEGALRRVAQWNGMQVFHPMDPRIDISKVGYLHLSPVAGSHPVLGRHGAGDEQTRNDEPPSLEHYEQLLEVVRPFFTSYGIGENPIEPQDAGQPHDAMASTLNVAQEQRSRHRAGSEGDSRTSTVVSHARSSSATFSRSGEGLLKDAPLHFPSDRKRAASAAVSASAPLLLAARQRPLQAAEAAEFYAPDDDPADSDDDDSDSSMVVLARIKRKHKQQSHDASSQDGNRNGAARHDHHHGNLHHERPAAMDEDDQDDRKPAGRPQSPLQHQEAPNRNQELQPQAEDDDEAAQGGGSASSSSSSSDQRIPPGAEANQARPNYDDAHVVTESSGNTNTTTSGSGSGSGSGANSGSNRGSSGSGNGSSGSGNEGKGSSEDVATKEGAGGASNSNSEDVNSDDRKAPDEMEIAHPVVARRHGAGAVTEGGVNDALMMDAPSPKAPSDQNVAARERKLQDKKRKRMNKRREYEEKVQQEMESSESSATKGAIVLRPGRPVTLDKVLSFTNIARMVIQAGPPFLVVHTNAAYTRLTGIDAHAAVGKPVSALLAVQGQHSTDGATEGAARENQDSSLGGEGQNQTHFNHDETVTTGNPFVHQSQGQGQSHAEAEEAGRARAAQASQHEGGNVNLERLVAVCGFGKYHVLHARARPHQMVGRNVTFVNKSGPPNGGLNPSVASSSPAANGMRRLDDGSSDTSLTTYFEGSFDSLKCRASISPIISDNIDSAVVTDTNQDPYSQKSKRRKLHHHLHGGADQQGSTATAWTGGHHHHHQRRIHTSKDSLLPKRYQQYVTHYAIQLELFDDSKELNDKGSMSSSSISYEANLLGLTKEELRRQRQAAQAGERGTSQEESEQRQRQDEDYEMASETTEGTAPVTAVG